ncbi:p17 [Dendrolimus punctatus virus]|uniref:p17 n=1 Tax=Dendrolimus punctatus virus TaxID=272751 RepID=Q6J654_9VIRU|nr:p17 [Dendrolimus punctatus virus]AAT27319.1 p17 [Dendrolimus punctatus virus]
MTDPLPAHLFHLPPGYSVAIIPPEQEGWELLEWTVTQPPAKDDLAMCGLQPTPSTSHLNSARLAVVEPARELTTSTTSPPLPRKSRSHSTPTLSPSPPMSPPCPSSVTGRVVNLTSTRIRSDGTSSTSTPLAPPSPRALSANTQRSLTVSLNSLSTRR